MSNAFHLSLDVPDLDEAVAFYRELLGVEPAKSKPGYAKFELADPPLALALQQASRGALSHFGIRVGSTDEVVASSSRLAEAGLATFDERDTTCCYARQDKVWVIDPSGNRWEVYTVLEDVGDDDAEREHGPSACCTPTEEGAVACC